MKCGIISKIYKLNAGDFMKKQDIKDLMRFFDNTEITKLKIKDGEFEIELEKGGEVVTVAAAPVAAAVPAAPTPVAAPAAEAATPAAPVADGPVINSPMVGTYYKAPAPGAEAFVKEGAVVKKGQGVAIIEAMKIMNEIEAEFDCRIVEILVEDGQPVEFDMPLFRVEKI